MDFVRKMISHRATTSVLYGKVIKIRMQPSEEEKKCRVEPKGKVRFHGVIYFAFFQDRPNERSEGEVSSVQL